MVFLTNFADPAVVLPLFVVAVFTLLVAGWPRGAFSWFLSGIGALGIVAALKIAVFACGPFDVIGLVRSPSGHTASAAIVYGGLACVLARLRGTPFWLSFVPAPIAASLIGYSRVALGVHTVPDVLIGGTIGTGGALALLAFSGVPPRRLRFPWLLGLAIVVAIVLHGHHFRVEGEFHRLAVYDKWLVPFCYGREDTPLSRASGTALAPLESIGSASVKVQFRDRLIEKGERGSLLARAEKADSSAE